MLKSCARTRLWCVGCNPPDVVSTVMPHEAPMCSPCRLRLAVADAGSPLGAWANITNRAQSGRVLHFLDPPSAADRPHWTYYKAYHTARDDHGAIMIHVRGGNGMEPRAAHPEDVLLGSHVAIGARVVKRSDGREFELACNTACFRGVRDLGRPAVARPAMASSAARGSKRPLPGLRWAMSERGSVAPDTLLTTSEYIASKERGEAVRYARLPALHAISITCESCAMYWRVDNEASRCSCVNQGFFVGVRINKRASQRCTDIEGASVNGVLQLHITSHSGDQSQTPLRMELGLLEVRGKKTPVAQPGAPLVSGAATAGGVGRSALPKKRIASSVGGYAAGGGASPRKRAGRRTSVGADGVAGRSGCDYPTALADGGDLPIAAATAPLLAWGDLPAANTLRAEPFPVFPHRQRDCSRSGTSSSEDQEAVAALRLARKHRAPEEPEAIPLLSASAAGAAAAASLYE